MPLNIHSDSVSKSEEKRIFSKIKQQDKDAFIKAYDLYIDQIYRFVYFKISDKEEAQDLTSTIFLKTWNYIQDNSVKDFKTLKALLYRVARNSVIDYYRKNSKINNTTLDGGEECQIDVKDETQDILTRMENLSDMEFLQEKLLEIKEEYREVIIMKYVDELSVAEIANVLEKSKGNIRVLLSRALKTVRDLVEEENQKNK